MLESILLVEDHPFDLELAHLALEGCNLPVDIIVARDGEEALNYLLMRGAFEKRAPGNPFLILLDLKLPKLDGIEVLKIIRSTPLLVDIPVVILSSLSFEPELLRSKALGIADYITKPLDARVLDGLLKKLVHQSMEHVSLRESRSVASATWN